jgi:hypothetical protein
VVIALAVLILGKALTWQETGTEILAFGLAISAAIAAIAFFSWVKHGCPRFPSPCTTKTVHARMPRFPRGERCVPYAPGEATYTRFGDRSASKKPFLITRAFSLYFSP